MGLGEGFLMGVVGGLLAELLGWYQLRKQAPPDFVRSWFYWLITGLMILAGGLLVDIYFLSDIGFKPIVAVNVGASAPLIIGKFVTQTPSIAPGKVN